ncbi:MAG: hypothetical protein FJZ09_07090 [Candidatus Omnitrophica bacterium]|nr:hypothetical protein [Candidatus Omnitrophota bacterium]
MRNFKKILIPVFFILLSGNASSGQDLHSGAVEKFEYLVRYNGMKVGKVEVEYLSRTGAVKAGQEIISLNSDVRILKLFSLKSREKFYIDAQTYFPRKVERDLELLGGKEKILEEYNQKKGLVRMIKTADGSTKEELIRQQPPIHNITALLFFFPRDVALKEGSSVYFNLPNRRLEMKVVRCKDKTCAAANKVFLLEAPAKKIKLWLEGEKRVPLRIEFPSFLGRISISRKTNKL